MPPKDDKAEATPPRLVTPAKDEPAAPSAPPRSGSPRCPHCDGKLKAHHAVEGPKAGAMHCETCGCCLIDGELREGHSACTTATV